MQGDRYVVSDRAVGSDLVVVSTPILQLLASIGKAHEPVRVQAFRPELRIERLDEAVVGRLAGAGEVQRDVVGIGPKIEVPGDEFAAVARREEGLPVGYGRARSPQIAQRVAITGSQVSTVVLLNHTAEETGYDRHPFYRADLAGRHRHFQASP